MSNNSGIFGLSAYNDQNLAGLIPDKTRESFREYGYFGGGFPGSTSIVDRIDYSNDTATTSRRGPLSLARRELAATGNSNFGYFGGGTGPLSTIDRIDYSNDSAIASLRGPLSQEKYASSASGNSNFGWFTGGHTDNNLTDINFSISTIDRIDYSNDLSTASIRGNLNQNRTNHSIAGNSNYGWIAGGNRAVNDGAYFTSIERLDYSNDVSLTSFRSTSNDISGQGNSATGNNNFGYHHRGVNPSGVSRTEVNRIDYSNDLVSPTLRGKLTLLITTRAATGNSNFGYFSGGLLIPGFTPNSSVERIDYSNDTTIASVRGPLSLGRGSTAATSSHNFGGSPISQYGVFPKPFGYFGGGNTEGTSSIDRVDYSNDTATASTRGPLSIARRSFAATGNSNFGYFGGGWLNPGNTSVIDRLDYSNDNQTTLVRGPLSTSKHNLSATGNYNFGYFGGGNTASSPDVLYSTIDRIDYSNDNATTNIRGPLSLARVASAATGNSNFGYFGGGGNPGPLSSVDRVNYSSDTQTASVRGPLLLAKLASAAIGNSNFGYFGGGNPAGTSSIDRIDYANDTAQASPRGPLSIARRSFAATGNSNFGYFGGGSVPGGLYFSTVDRIDYSNDTAQASPRGPLSGARGYQAATSPLTPSSAFSPDQLPLGFSNTDFQPTSTFFDIQSMRRIEDTTNASVKKRVLGSYGYFGGGIGDGFLFTSIINRIDYSNDSATASVRGPLSTTVRNGFGVGNSNFGYFGGGYNPSVSFFTKVDRIDYSNDLSITTVRGNLSGRQNLAGAIGNRFFGYMGGGDVSPTTVRKLDYSNDLSSISPRGSLVSPTSILSACGTENFGYFAGGRTSPGTSNSQVQRIDYSNDGVTASVRGPLSSANYGKAAAGNSNFGYFGGGTTITTVTRIDYANDTASSSVRGPLSLARRFFAAKGNSNFGYFSSGGIFIGFNVHYTTTDRVDYSNDTQTASVRGPLSLGRRLLAATTNARNS